MTNSTRKSGGGDTGADRPSTAMDVMRAARDQLTELTGTQVESVSSFARTEDGWELAVEVVELARIPDTTSLLATYEVSLDPDGELTTYRRVRRYERGRADPS
ncbi:gas vesicle protein [Streptomyces chengbuensis]|uniref:gas vesicle protein GvpO n=1 Tax=Streptomyces TaxID=1883 RepID=UPI0025B536EA|nr:gas vesicle protein [Streptomyces sp. HUAS CB01]WJY54151.1 gas vesicle protein [Streptomyces sp. HUAS CB01]